MTIRRTLIVTNDFPPRQGGIQSFVHALAVRQPAGSLMVYTSSFEGDAEFDRAQPFAVIRDRSRMLLPTPRVSRDVVAAARDFGAQAVWFGAAAPLGLLAPRLRAAGVERLVATTHGHEVGWALLPAARQMLRRIGSECDVVTYLGEYTRSRLAGALGPRAHLERLTPGVDVSAFSPNGTPESVRLRADLRQRYGLRESPTIVCVSRLVPRKGQDMLIRALPEIRRRVPDARLLLVGRGRYESSLRRAAQRAGVESEVIFTGAVAEAELPAHFLAGDVFAMPCRTRRFGLDVEGLGIVYLEASASGLPVIAGDSGGAPDAVQDASHGTGTGFVVDGRNLEQLTERTVQLLTDRALAARLADQGRRWVIDEWQWDAAARRLRSLLDS